MSVTYTPNIGLGLQLDKTEYLDWDVITANWQKIDAAAAGGGGGGINISIPEKIVYIPNRSPADVQIGLPEHISEPVPVQ